MKLNEELSKGNINNFLRVISNFISKLIPESSRLYKKMAFLGLKLTEKKRLSKRKQFRFDVPITDHCNLNCKCCWVFSPVAEKTFLNVKQYISDLHKLSEITNGEVSDIALAGGEPLLHPELIEIMDATRKYFTNIEIFIITNGTILKKQSDEFWSACRRNKIKVSITRYPIKLDFKFLKSKAEKEAVKLEYWGGESEPIKSMWKLPFDLNGTQDLEHSWKYCKEANFCMRLANGKIYPCGQVYSVGHFNKYFNTNMVVSEKDVLELDNIRNLDEILTFASTPPPFCKYCKKKDITFGLKWGISKKEISEWV